MMMLTRRIRLALTSMLMLTCLCSCIFDKDVDGPEQVPGNAAKLLCLNVAVPDMSGPGGAAGNDLYKPGVDFENYVDLSANGLRIYIFNAAGRFVTRLIPLGDITADFDGTSGTYTVTGALPDNFPAAGTIKVAVLANWPAYYDDLIPGVSTIDDLCNAEWAQFNRMTDFILSEENRIPFFGIHEYDGLSFEAGSTTRLQENISLLRAMAKVEVVVDNPAISLRDAKIRGINPKGFCAPAGVYSHADYDHNGNWELDYVKTLHLPGNGNVLNPEAQVASLLCINRHSDTRKESWVCYVPEYRNTTNPDGSGNYKSRLELLFDYQGATDKPAEVFFVDYDTNGKPVAGTDHDINRNNWYRFTVDLSQGNLFIKVKQWENAYDNDFIFE